MPKYFLAFVLATNKTTDTTGIAATKNKSGNSSSEARHALALLFSPPPPPPPELLPGDCGNKSGNSSSEARHALALLFSPPPPPPPSCCLVTVGTSQVTLALKPDTLLPYCSPPSCCLESVGNKSGNSSSEVIHILALLFSPELLPVSVTVWGAKNKDYHSIGIWVPVSSSI